MRPAVPQIQAHDLAARLEQGEPLQVLDIRSADRVAQGRIAIGAALDFRALPGSQMYRLPTLEPLGLDRRRPVAVVCGHGNSSQPATAFLREQGFEAFSVTGGMAAWEAVYVPHLLTPTPTIEHLVQLDRVGKGALSYVLASGGQAVVIDPGRHVDRYVALLRELRATPVAVVETHMHADFLSGARAAAAPWGVPHFVHPEDARSPYDDTPGRLAFQPLVEGTEIRFGRATLRAEHTPGHTLGSVTLVADDLTLTGDFVFVHSIGRPDLGGQAEAWARLLWRSLERARAEWPGDRVVLPGHYSGEAERRADRAIAARFDAVCATNEPLAIRDEATFLGWITQRQTEPPEAYRTIKLANLGLVKLALDEAEVIEAGQNQCAVG